MHWNLNGLKTAFTIKCLFCFVAVDIDFATRKIAISLSQTKVVVQDGDKFNFKTMSTFRNYDLAFTVDVEFDEFTKGLDNRNVKVGWPLIDEIKTTSNHVEIVRW